MTPYLPDYDELYVISDLHLGGRKDNTVDFQVFNRGARLGAFIDHVRTTRPEVEVALVLNGDVIDSLAEDDRDGYVACDATSADALMQRLYDDLTFQPVWTALAQLVRTAHRHLVIVIGNHDIELALPVVQDSIIQQIAGDARAARTRIQFATGGGGFACRVGGARVFCTHGNEVDGWNLVDYNRIGQLANAMNAGRAIDTAEWEPSAGTRLVVDVMNLIKKSHPFVDLLKPEAAAVAAVLMVLDRTAFARFDPRDVWHIGRDWLRGRRTVAKTLAAKTLGVSAEDVGHVMTFDSIAEELLGPRLREVVTRQPSVPVDEDEMMLNPTAAPMATLGVRDVIAGLIGHVSRVEAIWRALDDWLGDDTSFDPTSGDGLYRQMQERVGDDVDFVVTGHTHLARALPFGRRGCYFNSGTWIRLLRLPRAVLVDLETFERELWPLLENANLATLDAAVLPDGAGGHQPLVFDRTNVVRIAAESGTVVGELLRVVDGSPGTVRLIVEPGTCPLSAGQIRQESERT